MQKKERILGLGFQAMFVYDGKHILLIMMVLSLAHADIPNVEITTASAMDQTPEKRR